MTNIQTIIVFMWFVPILGFIVLPLLWSLYRVLYRVVDYSRLSDIRGFVALNNLDSEVAGIKEKRERSRILLEEGQACIDEKSDCCRAKVSNISKHGLCLRNIPRKMYLESNLFRVVFRTRQKDYTVMARPIWKKMTEKGYMIGAEIDRIPAEWNNLVKGLRQSLTPVPASVL